MTHPFVSALCHSALWVGAVALCIVAAYFTSLFSLGFRLGALQKSGQAQDAPTAREFLWSRPGAAALFVLSSRHKKIGDRAVTRLVIMTRIFAVASAVSLLISFLTDTC